MSLAKSVRIGYLTHLDGDTDPDILYERSLRVARHVERLGFDSLWVSERHFHQGRAGTPDALTWLAAVARETTTVRLGTAIVPVSVRHPVDIAERAALVDAISGGRLELGLGTGIGGPTQHVFHQPGPHDLHDATDIAEAEITRLLSGETVLPDSIERIFPPRPALARRVWRATQRKDAVRAVAARGHGLLLPRARYGAPLPRDQWQAHMARVYRHALEAAAPTARPRIAVSRTLYPAVTIEAGLDDFVTRRTRFDIAPSAPETRSEVAAALAAEDVLYGPADHLAAALDVDVSIPEVTDLLIGFQPAILTEPQELEKLEILSNEVLQPLSLDK